MKDLVRSKTYVNEEIEKVLNEQIKVEAHASSVYLAMSSWCGSQGYDFSAEFFAKQVEEERLHMLKLFNYVNETLEMEMHVTHLFNNMADQCITQKDFVT